MKQEIAIIIFKLFWFSVLVIFLIAQVLLRGKIKKKSSATANFIVALPYIIVFGWFSARDYIGIYNGFIATQILGIILMLAGVIGYGVSIFHLRANWTIPAAIREGHTLIVTGSYRYVRHPMYFFMLLIILGSGFLISDYLIVLYVPVIFLIYYWRASKEEELLSEEFKGYKEYQKNTKMIIPNVF